MVFFNFNFMGKTNYWMVSTLVLLGIIIGFGVSQMSYFKDIGSKGKTQLLIIKRKRKILSKLFLMRNK